MTEPNNDPQFLDWEEGMDLDYKADLIRTLLYQHYKVNVKR